MAEIAGTVAAALSVFGLLVLIWWLVGRGLEGAEPSVFTLMHNAGVVCPYCGREPRHKGHVCR